MPTGDRPRLRRPAPTAEPPGSRGTGASRPETLGALIPRVLHELGLDETSKAVRVLELWPEAVGPEMAPHCRPEGIRHDVLHANVRDSAWMQRLQMHKPRILAALEEGLGEPAALDLRLRVGDVD